MVNTYHYAKTLNAITKLPHCVVGHVRQLSKKQLIAITLANSTVIGNLANINVREYKVLWKFRFP